MRWKPAGGLTAMPPVAAKFVASELKLTFAVGSDKKSTNWKGAVAVSSIFQRQISSPVPVLQTPEGETAGPLLM